MSRYPYLLAGVSACCLAIAAAYFITSAADPTYLYFLVTTCVAVPFCFQLIAARGSGSKLAGGFLVVALIHIVFSYASGYLFLETRSFLVTKLENYVSQAAALCLLGFFFSLFGVFWRRHTFKRHRSATLRWSTTFVKTVNETWAIRRAYMLVLISFAALTYVYLRIGYLPLLSDDPDLVRYFGGNISGTYLLEYSIFRRCLMIVGTVTPFLWLIWEKRRSWPSFIMSLGGLLVLALSAQRIRVVLPVLMVLVVRYLSGRLNLRQVAGFVGIIVAFTVATQIVIQSRYPNTGRLTPVQALGSVFSEIPDLGWILASFDPPFYYGKTYLADLLPVPKEVMPYKQDYGLTDVTKRLIGYDQVETFAGLRITAFGEAYLNFWYAGVAILGFLIGCCVFSISSALQAQQEMTRGDPLALYPMAVLWTYVAFVVYLAGSMAALDFVGTIGVLIVLYAPRPSFGFLKKPSPISVKRPPMENSYAGPRL
jgi:oligosaccharide repeat unit polymerase